MFDVLTEAGEIDGADVAMYEARGARASGFDAQRGRDDAVALPYRLPRRSSSSSRSARPTSTLTVRRMTGFLEPGRRRAVAAAWRRPRRLGTWPNGSHEAWSTVGEIRLIVLTNADLQNHGRPSRAARRPEPCTSRVWDLRPAASARHQRAGPGTDPHRRGRTCGAQPIPCLGPQGDPGALRGLPH